MSSAAYDDSNIFAKILRGEIPSHKLYEDDETFAFMDIMPRGDGHCLVIPKKPARNILDAEPASLTAVMATVQKLARAVFGAGRRRSSRRRWMIGAAKAAVLPVPV